LGNIRFLNVFIKNLRPTFLISGFDEKNFTANGIFSGRTESTAGRKEEDIKGY
jgi:hypothetical protein